MSVFLVTRPTEQGALTTARLRALGHEALCAPLLTILPLAWQPPAEPRQAVLLTSRHAAPALPQSGLNPQTPVLSVGAQTAQAAREAGYPNVQSAEGDATSLAALVRATLRPEAGPLLYLAGDPHRQTLADQLGKAGYTLDVHKVYRAEAATSLPADALEVLRAGHVHGALVYSPRTAALLSALMPRDLRGGLHLHGLSAEVISAAGEGWAGVHVAKHPTEDSLLQTLTTSGKQV